MDAYKTTGLKDELKILNDELKKKNLPKVKRDTRVHKTWNKAVYASCISAARLQLLDVDKNWIENRKVELWESNDMQRMSKERVYQEKLKSELENKFFCLKDTQKYNEQRNANLNDLHCYTFNCPQSNENENESNNSMVDEHAGSSQQIVFSSDDDDDTHDGGIETEEHQNNKNSKRDSMGGKDLLANLGSLF